MAPEIFNVDPDVEATSYDKAVDIWALGVMFHELLFGERPFEGNQIQIANNV